MPINVKMPTTFISMINTTSESLKVRKIYIFSKFLLAIEILCSVDSSVKKFYNLKARSSSGNSQFRKLCLEKV